MNELRINSFVNTGVYPLIDIYDRKLSYFVVENIPFISQIYDNRLSFREWKKYERQRIVFLSSILIAESLEKDCPHTYSSFYFDEIGEKIIISLKNKNSSVFGAKLKNKVKNIISGKTKIPKADCGLIERVKKGEEISFVAFPKYSGFNSSKYCKSFKCKNIKLTANRVQVIYKTLSQQSRHIHISLYYLLRANSLLHKYFTEEAGVSLQMVIEAIIEDYMSYKKINRKQAFETLRNIKINGIEDLVEHGLARNEFLAHIDKDMFTESENINDPDMYCYETYRYFVDFIMKYIQFKKKGFI